MVCKQIFRFNRGETSCSVSKALRKEVKDCQQSDHFISTDGEGAM